MKRRSGLSIAVTALALVAVGASPAYGAKPVRTVVEPNAPYVIPAGFGCSFDVLWDTDPNARIVDTEFADGRFTRNTNADPTFINLETGASFHHRARYHATETYDPITNEVFDDVSGSIVAQFYPGDEGPYGLVAEPGALLRFTGNTHSTFDLDTGLFTAFSYEGLVVDVCAELS